MCLGDNITTIRDKESGSDFNVYLFKFWKEIAYEKTFLEFSVIISKKYRKGHFIATSTLVESR
jgi:hypothetical protein